MTPAPDERLALSEKTSETDDQRIRDVTPLPPPEHLIRFFPIAGTPVETLVSGTRNRIRQIMAGEDDRLLVIVGPCSIHDPAAVNPATALPADAILPGAPGVRGIACALDPAPDGTARRVSVVHPWSAAPMLIGPEGPRPARFFKRGRTLIFDAGRTVLYIDRDHHHATLSLSTPRAVQNLRGRCRVTP